MTDGWLVEEKLLYLHMKAGGGGASCQASTDAASERASNDVQEEPPLDVPLGNLERLHDHCAIVGLSGATECR